MMILMRSCNCDPGKRADCHLDSIHYDYDGGRSRPVCGRKSLEALVLQKHDVIVKSS